jgi:hypothetical protein
MFWGGWKSIDFCILLLFENKRKERVFLSLTASQLTSRHLTTNPATISIKQFKGGHTKTFIEER